MAASRMRCTADQGWSSNQDSSDSGSVRSDSFADLYNQCVALFGLKELDSESKNFVYDVAVALLTVSRRACS